CSSGPSSSSMLRAQSSRVRELRWLRDGGLAREALADIDRRLAVDSCLALEERHAVRGAEGDDRIRVEGGERRPRHVVLGPADDRDLAGRREVEVEGAQRPGEE